MEHELKTWPEPFDAVARGDKMYEIRRDDRPFRTGDLLRLRRWDPLKQEYTGAWIQARVGYLSRGGSWGLPGDLCVMSLADVVVVGDAALRAALAGKGSGEP